MSDEWADLRDAAGAAREQFRFDPYQGLPVAWPTAAQLDHDGFAVWLGSAVDDRYIAAASPDRILRLLAERDRLAARADEAEANVIELQALFDLQQTRMGTATQAWRDANPGNDLVLPDLGRLLDWLVQRSRDADAWQGLVRRIVTTDEYDHMDAVGAAADLLGLKWDDVRDRYIEPEPSAEQLDEPQRPLGLGDLAGDVARVALARRVALLDPDWASAIAREYRRLAEATDDR